MECLTTPMIAWENYLWAGVAVLGLLLFIHLVALRAQGALLNDDAAGKRKQVRGISSLIVGKDGRTSTSKVAAALWTIALCFAFLVLLFDHKETTIGTLDANYLLLLGGPFVALIGAKKITSDRVDSGKSKKEATDERGGAKRAAEVVTDDDGDVDIGDFQYFAFSLVTLTYFFVLFVRHPACGLPELSDTMVLLSTASAAGYLGKKAVTPAPQFKITSVVPGRVTLYSTPALKVSGAGFGGPGEGATESDPAAPRALLLDEAELAVTSWSDTYIEADLGLSELTGLSDNQQAEVVVVNDAGARSEAAKVKVEEPD